MSASRANWAALIRYNNTKLMLILHLNKNIYVLILALLQKNGIFAENIISFDYDENICGLDNDEQFCDILFS